MEHSMKRSMVSGVAYTAVAKYSGVIISLVVAGILSRLLGPKEFGIVAVATVISTFFSIISDLGIAPAIIQNKTLEARDYHSIFSFTFWMAVVVSVVFFGCSRLISSYYGFPELVRVCQFLTINLFFATLNIVPNGLFYKEKRFSFISKRTLVIQLSCGVVAVASAFMGAGIYALLITPICSSVIVFIVNIIQYPQRLILKLEWGSIAKIFSFSAYQLLFNVINYFSRNLDKLLIGRYLGMNLLGYYDKSYRLMMLPLDNVTNVISPVLHPILSEFQHDLKRVSTSYLEVVKLLGFIGFPLSVFLFFDAKELILLVFGGQWEPSVPVFKILTLTVGVQIIMSSSGALFQASNATKLLFLSGVLSTLLNIFVILVGIFVFKRIEYVAAGIVCSFSINFIQCFYLLFVKALRSKLSLFFKELISPVLLSLILAVVTYFMDLLIAGYPLLLTLSIKFFFILGISFVYVQVSKAYDLISMVKKLRHYVS